MCVITGMRWNQNTIPWSMLIFCSISFLFSMISMRCCFSASDSFFSFRGLFSFDSYSSSGCVKYGILPYCQSRSTVFAFYGVNLTFRKPWSQISLLCKVKNTIMVVFTKNMTCSTKFKVNNLKKIVRKVIFSTCVYHDRSLHYATTSFDFENVDVFQP